MSMTAFTSFKKSHLHCNSFSLPNPNSMKDHGPLNNMFEPNDLTSLSVDTIQEYVYQQHKAYLIKADTKYAAYKQLFILNTTVLDITKQCSSLYHIIYYFTQFEAVEGAPQMAE
ncbi:hypothetical protein GOP47_0023270 [Adiantum capillus-veneris]|uniref:Uncharacterized protein n=1 Tax=Adiantum capillus-veneris TaxID=13818 RepID=A0A9D4U9A7_ADICA|nr:hypothetical protein GOP47_0023270 [Adiantum capillus-veneris]